MGTTKQPQANEFFLSVNGPSGLTLVIEDDGRVAWAYLLKDGAIQADVWLYNWGRPSALPEWESAEAVPFRNPAGYAFDLEFEPIGNEQDIRVAWLGETGVEIAIRGRVHARLSVGDKPGFCILAKLAGPLAKLLALS